MDETAFILKQNFHPKFYLRQFSDGEVLRAAASRPDHVQGHPGQDVLPVSTGSSSRRHPPEHSGGSVQQERPGGNSAFPVQGSAAVRHDGPQRWRHATGSVILKNKLKFSRG